MRHRSKLDEVLSNPALHPKTLTDRERSDGFKWHDHAESHRSSQIFCLSAFGTLRCLTACDRVLEKLFSHAFTGLPSRPRPRHWEIIPEFEEPTLLGETGGRQPAFCVSSREVICVESKYIVDARDGFGGCSQFSKGACAGFYGSGSDLQSRTAAWCRLENWEGDRAPRLYWALGKRFFNESVFQRQHSDAACPLRGSSYQLMRNFLFAATYAERHRKDFFGLLAIALDLSDRLSSELAEFETQFFCLSIAIGSLSSNMNATSNCWRCMVTGMARI
jgi:hypothetical protein